MGNGRGEGRREVLIARRQMKASHRQCDSHGGLSLLFSLLEQAATNAFDDHQHKDPAADNRIVVLHS